MSGFSRLQDEQNNLVAIMCPICFEYNEPVPARAGGRLSTIDGEVYDVCVDCATKEYLYLANLMGA